MAFEHFKSTNLAILDGGSSSTPNSSHSNQMKYNAEELRNMAMFLRNSDVTENFNQVSSHARTIAAYCWQGPDAEAFATKIDELMKKIIAMTNDVYMEMATKLDRAADELENTTHDIMTGINKF